MVARSIAFVGVVLVAVIVAVRHPELTLIAIAAAALVDDLAEP